MLHFLIPNIMLNAIMVNVNMLSVIMLSVIMLSVIMLSVIMLSVIMLNVIMLSFIMLSVAVLRLEWKYISIICSSLLFWCVHCTGKNFARFVRRRTPRATLKRGKRHEREGCGQSYKTIYNRNWLPHFKVALGILRWTDLAKLFSCVIHVLV
jgi:hypothetical protein